MGGLPCRESPPYFRKARMSRSPERLVTLEPSAHLWERVFMVAPVVLVGTRDEDGSWDLAPKHMAMPMGWGARFGFICTPRHATYRNVVHEGAFTVSYPKPSQILSVTLAAALRCDDASKPLFEALPVSFPRIRSPVLSWRTPTSISSAGWSGLSTTWRAATS